MITNPEETLNGKLSSTTSLTGTITNYGSLNGEIASAGGSGTIETIKVNGEVQTITNKTVNLTVPTKTSE